MKSDEHMTDDLRGDNGKNGGEVHVSFEHDIVSGRNEIKIWGTSSALPVDLSTAEWLALCREIRSGGEQLLDLSTIGSRIVIQVDELD